MYGKGGRGGEGREREGEGKRGKWREGKCYENVMFNILFILCIEHVIIYLHKSTLPEVEGFFFSVVSFFHLLELEQKQSVVDKLCTEIMAGATTESGQLKLRM